MLRMIPVASAATLVSVATLMAVAAAAAPRSIADCEAIQAADAYNRCLASFGPVAAGHSHDKALPYTASATEDVRGGGRSERACRRLQEPSGTGAHRAHAAADRLTAPAEKGAP